MAQNMKKWLIIAAVLIFVGGMIFVGAMAMVKWDFKKLSTAKYQTNTHEIQEEFRNISLITDTADVDFLPAEDGICKVICYEQTNVKHIVTVADDTLKIQLTDERKWYEYIGVNFGTPKLTVYLPESEYGAVTVETSTGDVRMPKDFLLESLTVTASTADIYTSASATGAVKLTASTGKIHAENMMAQSLDISVSTGKVTASGVACEEDIALRVSTGDAKLTDIVCKSVISTGNTGDITLENVIAADRFTLERSTGKVRFERSDASEIDVTTSTGDVTGSLLSDFIYIVDTKTGKIVVPKTISGGRCEITTDTGDIILTVYKVEE